MAANNTPPQYVFEIVAIEAIKKFLAVDVPPEEVAKFFAALIAEQYDTRVYKASKSFVAYAYGMRSEVSPLKPDIWTIADEIEFAPIFEVIRPPVNP